MQVFFAQPLPQNSPVFQNNSSSSSRLCLCLLLCLSCPYAQMFCGHPTISEVTSYILRKSPSYQPRQDKTVILSTVTFVQDIEYHLSDTDSQTQRIIYLTTLVYTPLTPQASSLFFTAVFLIFYQSLNTLVSKIENMLCLFLLLQ